MQFTRIERGRLLAKFFSRPVFASLAERTALRSTSELLTRYQLTELDTGGTLSDMFESAWTQLRSQYRSEYVYKNELANRLVFGRHSPNTAALYVEMPIGRSIVDVAIFNGTSTAYEVKTEFDSTRRLSTQTFDYLKAFDRVYVVTHPSLVAAYQCAIPAEVGVLALKPNGSLSTHREATSNRENVSPEVIFGCLHRSEYTRLLSDRGTFVDHPSGVIEDECRAAFSLWSRHDAHDAFVNELRARKTDLDTVTFVSQLPASLRALGYGTPLSSKKRSAILENLQSTL